MVVFVCFVKNLEKNKKKIKELIMSALKVDKEIIF
jgi:hypothetical protein